MKSISKQAIGDSRLTQDEDQALLSSIEEIIEDLRKGKPVIIVDDEDRENEGDLVIAAEMATPETINFMAKEGRGLICLPMEKAMIDRLGLELMGRGDNSRHQTAFTVSIEAKEGVTTGISAADRAHTIQTAIAAGARPSDIATPGHIFPLSAREGGVLERAGHTEAAVDLAKMAGFTGAGVICEIMNDDGTMARLPDLVGYAQRHALKIGTIADLIEYRRSRETLVEKIYSGSFLSAYNGNFKLYLYKNKLEYTEHIVLVKGNIEESDEPILVRMHAVDIFEDVLGKTGHMPIQTAMEKISKANCGVIVVLRDSNPMLLSQKLTRLEEKGKSDDQTPGNRKDLRRYGIGAQILNDLGVKTMTLLTDHPKHIIGLEGYGLEVKGFEPLHTENSEEQDL